MTVLAGTEITWEEMAEQFGTPLYAYSRPEILDRVRRLRAAVGEDVLLAYACKANSNGAILTLLARAGMGADVVSGGEMTRAIKAGMRPEKIVFSGVGKTDDELIAAARAGIGQINIESAQELDRLLSLPLPRAVRVAFRVNPDIDAKTHAKISTGHGDSKFGIASQDIPALYARAMESKQVIPVGLSIHLGSNIAEIGVFEAGLAALAALVRDVPRAPETLDIGGGLASTMDDAGLRAYRHAIDRMIRPLNAKIILEPGRFILADAGVLLTRVIGTKKAGGRTMVILDAGMNDLMRPALYDATHPIIPVRKRNGQDIMVDLVGPVCESSDVFARDVLLPPLHAGDLVAIAQAGAYGFSMANTYNSRPLPPEILIDGKRYDMIRRRQEIDDLSRDEIIPDWVGA